MIFLVCYGNIVAIAEQTDNTKYYESFKKIFELVEKNYVKEIDKQEMLDAALKGMLDSLDPYSEERDAFATAILGGSYQLSFDSDGRILLPELLIEKAKLSEQALFIGKGETFEIWNPKVFGDFSEKAREIAKANRHLLTFKKKLDDK